MDGNDNFGIPEQFVDQMSREPMGKPKDQDDELGLDMTAALPLYDYVLLRWEKPAEEKADLEVTEKKTAGGIIIPERDLQGKTVRKYVEKKYMVAEVVRTGVGNFDMQGHEQPWPFQPGDKVLIPRHGGLNMLSRRDMKLYRVLRGKEIIMVLGKGDTGMVDIEDETKVKN